MGEVYQGLDTRLGRAVALKVISRSLVGDEDTRTACHAVCQAENNGSRGTLTAWYG